MDRIGTALIGCGKVADAHAQAFNTLDESRFLAVYDIDRERVQAFARRYNIRGQQRSPS